MGAKGPQEDRVMKNSGEMNYLYGVGWSDVVLDAISSKEEAEVYRRAGLKEAVVGGGGVLSLAADKQWDLLTGYANRPLRANSPFFFKHAKMKGKSEIPPAPPLPKEMAQYKQDHQNEALAKIQLN